MRGLLILFLGLFCFTQISQAQCVTNYDTIVVPCEADTGDAIICLPFNPLSYFASTIVVGADTLSGFPVPCDPDTVRAYDMSITSGVIGCDSIQLTMPWIKNGDTLIAMGTYFDSLGHLVDSMDLLDPTGGWAWDGSNFISTINNSDTFSNLDIFSWCTFESNNVALNRVIFFGGIEVSVPNGSCLWITVTVDSSGCISDSILICSYCVTTDTIWVPLMGGDTDTSCVSTSEMIGGATTIGSCDGSSMTSGGVMLTYIDDTCVAYTAPAGYMGDTTCVILCDSAVCDTTWIIYMPMGSPCDTLIPDDTMFVEHCADTDTIVCLPVNPVMAITWTISVAGDTISPFSIVGCLPDTMRAYDLTISDSVLNCDTLQLIAPWTKNGDTLIDTGYYSSWTDIVAAIVAADPTGGWAWDGSQFLSTINFSDTFSDIQVFSFCKGTWNMIALNRVITFRGAGIPVPADTCVELIINNNAGCIDTTIVCVYCPLPPLVDTTPYETPVTYCWDDTAVAFDTMYPCDTPSMGTTMMVSDSCIEYTPAAGWYGWDTACIVVCDTNGVCDTLTWYIFTLPPDTIIAAEDWDTTRVNTPIMLCVLDNDTYLSRPCPDSMHNLTSPAHGMLELDTASCKFRYTPDSGWCGTDSFKYVICDALGCDSTWAFIVVQCIDAVEDWDTTAQDEPVVVDVLANDLVPCDSLMSMEIITDAANGSAVVNSDWTITYTPAMGWCGTDSFQYAICCDSMDCDTAWAYVVVECAPEDILIYNGFSPNGDGINDLMIINGAEGCDVTLQVYNRWGNIVYKQDNYQNDWNGTWQKSGEDLPDGTYYYIVRFSNCDNDRNVVQNKDLDPTVSGVSSSNVAGYVTIHRGSKN